MTSDAYEAIKSWLASREWRLDNLYFIQNERGEVVRFVRNNHSARSGTMPGTSTRS